MDKILSTEWRDLSQRQRIWIVPGFTSFVEDFVIRCYQVKLFCSWNRSLIASPARTFVILVLVHMSQFRSLGKWVSTLCFRFFVSPLLKHHLPNLRSLFQKSVRAHASPGPPEKGCNQSGMLCVGSSSFISSFLRAELRFPEACLALRVFIGSDDVSDLPKEFDWSFGLDVEAELLLENDDNPGTTRGTKLSIIQVIVFPFFWSIVEFRRFSTHVNIRVLSKAFQAIQLLAFLRVIALWRTDRDL